MSVTRVGATKQYSDNWDQIFGGKRMTKTKAAAAPARKSAKKSAKRGAKKSARKSAKKTGKAKR